MPNIGPMKELSTPRRRNLPWLTLAAVLCAISSPAWSQQAPSSPDTPNPAAPVITQQAAQQTPGSITGKVVDQTGVFIAGARVTLTREGQAAGQETLSDDKGTFSFTNIPPGPFQLNFFSEGLASQEFSATLHPGETLGTPLVMMVVATQVTQVRVELTPVELAQEQIRDQEKQRVFGIIPNFFVTYDRKAVPLNARQKFELAWKSSKDPFTFVAVGLVAGANDAGGRWRGYGPGVQGYAKRYGASYADVFTGTYIGGAVLPTLLKQDPRYFYKGTGSKRSRLLYALSSGFIAKGDNGHWQPNYSNIGGDLSAGALANLYYPSTSHHGASLVFSTALVRLGETTIAAIFQEFFVPRFTPNLPTRAPSADPPQF